MRELRRVARERVVIMTYDPARPGRSWLMRDYLPELAELDVRRFPAIEEQAAAAGNACRVDAVPLAHDCRDGFLGAYWRRPHAYLDSEIRAGISTFHLPGADSLLDGLDRLAEDLKTGRWEQRNRDILERAELDVGHRLITAQV